MSHESILKCTVLCAVSALWIGVIVACGNPQPSASADVDRTFTPEVVDKMADDAAREVAKALPPPPPPPPPEPATPDAGAAPAADGGAAPVPCGRPGQPMCPMQEYMKRTMLPAMRSGQGIEESFTKVAGWAPDPSWNEGPNGWRTTAEAGAAAIKAANKAGAQAACKACHTAWQKRYRAELRPRPLPTP